MNFLIVLLVAVALGQATAEKMRFDNHTLYRIVPKTKEMVETLRSLSDTAYFTGLNFFSEVHKENFPVDVLVDPTNSEFVKTVLSSPEVNSELLVEDFQKVIDAEGLRPESRANSFGWTSYHTLEEINNFLETLARIYPDKVTLLTGGKTHQGRHILGVKLSFSRNNAKHSVFLEANIHAREWVTSAVATYILNQLITSRDSQVRLLAESYDWYIFPVTNPDGFVHSHTNNRLWRKTRTPYTTFCYGADPNRNWAYQWMNGGASNQPCSDTYAGPRAFSEPSTNSLSHFINSIGPNLEAYISFHSYSQMLLVPYGHTTRHLDNYNELVSIGRDGINALASRYGTRYVVGNIAEIIYVATGGSMDWVKDRFGTPLTYTYELRDTGTHGFVLPANQIIPTGLETLDSLVAIFRSYRRRHPRA